MVKQTQALTMNDLLARREEIIALAKTFKANNIRVFGSVARGEAKATSDVDFLVTFQPDYTLWDHIGLIQELEDLLGCKVDVSTEKTLRKSIYERVLPEVVWL